MEPGGLAGAVNTYQVSRVFLSRGHGVAPWRRGLATTRSRISRDPAKPLVPSAVSCVRSRLVGREQTSPPPMGRGWWDRRRPPFGTELYSPAAAATWLLNALHRTVISVSLPNPARVPGSQPTLFYNQS